MTVVGDIPQPTSLRAAVEAAHRADETAAVRALLAQAEMAPEARRRVADTARRLVLAMRQGERRMGGLDAFLREYELTSEEGVVLMCLAEALLRVPDAATADRLIRDKIADADWRRHLGHSESLFVNASTWALMLTGRLVDVGDGGAGDVGQILKRLAATSGEPLIREALRQAMRILGRQFVMGRTIGEALARARDMEARGYRYSFDMLGEAAVTMAEADDYMRDYGDCIAAVGRAGAGRGIVEGPGVSVKLSALHPRYELAQKARVMAELVPRLIELAAAAKRHDIGLCIDAEEADRLDLSLDVVEAMAGDPRLAGWNGLGLAVQAYSKRTPAVIDWLADLAHRHRRRLMLRLVKGAYWDTEIKRAQEQGLDGYPVYTRKTYTDLSYQACAKKILTMTDAFFPQFATHNAQSLATVLELVGDYRDFEFQRLHGMGEALHELIVERGVAGPGRVATRIYAPVGSHEDLLAYLVRRLLENGANTSFVNRIVDKTAPVDEIVAEPRERTERTGCKPHPRIPLPARLYGDRRENSRGLDLGDPSALRALAEAMRQAEGPARAAPMPGGNVAGDQRPVLDPADRRRQVGAVVEATDADIERAATRAAAAAAGWDATPAETRAAALERAGALIGERRAALVWLLVREAGKTLPDCLSEVREAEDFCRYYAARARADFARPLDMPGPTGERNQLELRGRGVFACISPWNFPLAIFVGQASAALAAGNAVVAKPAEQTPLVAAAATQILHRAGVPADALHLLPGDGPTVGAPLVRHPNIAGVAFTGSVETARLINRALAERPGPIVPLIAETGGQNAMVVDSTALPEQVVADAVTSAFRSAGQRCSALRVLLLQDDIADRVLEMLVGAAAELRLGDPGELSTDVGPVIDEAQLALLEAHAGRMATAGRILYRGEVPASLAHGIYFAPMIVELDGLAPLEREVFGPIVHVIRYPAERLAATIAQVNATGYGLTLGIQSRVDATQHDVYRRMRVGNTYVNRNMIGAVVGVHPFGGEGLSGTGPKAGGPRYLHRFAVERTLSVNTAAAGGNAKLFSLAEEAPE